MLGCSFIQRDFQALPSSLKLEQTLLTDHTGNSLHPSIQGGPSEQWGAGGSLPRVQKERGVEHGFYPPAQIRCLGGGVRIPRPLGLDQHIGCLPMDMGVSEVPPWGRILELHSGCGANLG